MQFFEKRLEDVQKHTHGKLVTTEKKNKIFGIRTKLSNFKIFHRNFVDCRNEKKSNTHKSTCLFEFVNTKTE